MSSDNLQLTVASAASVFAPKLTKHGLEFGYVGGGRTYFTALVEGLAYWHGWLDSESAVDAIVRFPAWLNAEAAIKAGSSVLLRWWHHDLVFDEDHRLSLLSSRRFGAGDLVESAPPTGRARVGGDAPAVAVKDISLSSAAISMKYRLARRKGDGDTYYSEGMSVSLKVGGVGAWQASSVGNEDYGAKHRTWSLAFPGAARVGDAVRAGADVLLRVYPTNKLARGDSRTRPMLVHRLTKAHLVG